jgi:cytochrome c-type biogenesis protein CcmE
MTINNDVDLRLLDASPTDPDPGGPAGSAPPHRPQRRRMTPTRVRMLVAGLVLLIAAGYLVVSATTTSAVYYLTISELRGMGAQASTQPVRVGGIVVPGTIQRDGSTLRFLIVDAAPDTPYDQIDMNALKMNVVYKGIVPDIFQDEVHVVVEGKLISGSGGGGNLGGNGNGGGGNGGDDIFNASNLLAKCPSRFESMPGDAQSGSGQPGK